MRTTLELDDDLVAAAREIASAERRSLGSVISELARRGLTPARVAVEGDVPVIRVPAGAPPITPDGAPRPRRALTPMALLDVNALVALAWDAHIHHAAMRAWFAAHRHRGWATCPITESGFVRVSSNPRAVGSPITVGDARRFLLALRETGGHRFVTNDVSMTSDELPRITRHRDVTDAVLLVVARRHGLRLVTFDRGLLDLAQGRDVELLAA